MSARVILSIAVLLTSEACPPAPNPPPPPTPVQDASVPPSRDASILVEASPPAPAPEPQPEAGPVFPTDPCGQACAKLYGLGCREAMPTPRGVSCHDVCQQVEAFAGLTLHPGSVAACRDVACVRKVGIACKP